MGWRGGKGRKQKEREEEEEEGGEEKRFKKWIQLEVRKETKGFPVKSKTGGLRA